MSDDLTREQRRKNMQHIKSNDTKIEVLLRKALWKKGYRYRKNYKELPGKPDIENGKHVSSLIAAYKNPKATILISLLEEVPYCFDNYYKDAQRLASAENYWIDKYQGMNQCLEQVPEGKRPSIDACENMKLYQNN